MKWLLAKLLRLGGLLALCLGIMAVVWLAAAGSLLTRPDAPEASEAIVLLCGDYSRTRQAADLLAQGYAPEIWVARPRRDSARSEILALAGVDMPPQEEIHRRLLIHYGVPESAVRFYGHDVVSTVQEARELARNLGPSLEPGANVIIVTSPYHLRRARMIFADALPGLRVLAVPTAYETFREDWWTDQDSARAVILETTKLAWYLAGGTFSSDNGPEPEAAPAAGVADVRQ